MQQLLQFLADNNFTLKVEHTGNNRLIINLSQPSFNFYCAFEIDKMNDFDSFYSEYLYPVLDTLQKVAG